jgi:hypothetical protein
MDFVQPVPASITLGTGASINAPALGIGFGYSDGGHAKQVLDAFEHAVALCKFMPPNS